MSVKPREVGKLDKKRSGLSSATYLTSSNQHAILPIHWGEEKVRSTGFFAYPAGSAVIKDAIHTAVELSRNERLELKPWERMKIVGFKLDDLIREQIADADVLIADITYPSANVFYEIGYAIAAGKPVLPTVNSAVSGAVTRIQKIGLFDTLGWITYENGDQLSLSLRDWRDVSWANKFVRDRNHSKPLFILDTLMKTDFRNHIFHAADNAHVNYRTYDPTQIPRLTAAQAISEISSSAGVIVSLLSPDIVDSEIHNLRASFLLGLSHGYEIEAMAIQYENHPAPLDYRDFISNSTYRKETEKHITAYCEQTLVWNQKLTAQRSFERGLLTQIDLGSPAAENESEKLEAYFVKTAEFARATRAEGATIIGRKGSGKTAVYLEIAREVGRDRHACVVDLRPASHNLSEMRETLLSVSSAGVFDHTISAFWQYIIYIEVMLKIREKALPASKNDYALQTRLRDLEAQFSLNDAVVSGDFTSRLEKAVRDVVQVAQASKSETDIRAGLTNLMFEKPIPSLRDAIVGFSEFYSDIVVLIDDLDKGWPPRQVEAHDASTVKHLIEVLGRIRRDLTRRKAEFRHLIFLRSDIYEKLVEITSDRGKYNLIRVDWSDPAQLRNLLYQRVISRIDPASHQAAWSAINPTMPDGGDAVSAMIEGSLRRPRFLIDLCERVLSFAINRGHASVTPEDVESGLTQMALYLVSDFGYEMRDIAGTPEDIFYHFIGTEPQVSEEDLAILLSEDTLGLGLSETIDFLLWYGFLGIVTGGQATFIYDRAYDFRRLEAERANTKPVIYAINPAFLKGLQKPSSVTH